MQRLSDQTLPSVPSHIVRPLYDRASVPTRIVHLGAGAFHRSHQALYTDDIMQAGHSQWGILGASWHNCALPQALTAQDGLYTLLINDNGVKTARVVGSLNKVVCLADARQTVLNHLASPQTQIVSLTITEQGYCYDSRLQTVDETRPEIQTDIAEPWNARSAVGLLAWSILERKKSGLKPFTLLSCDNLPNNGKVLQRVLERYIERVQNSLNEPDLLQYFLDQYACPCTLVDRITPPATTADRIEVQEVLGLHDDAPVVAEPFSQWVIQDWFSADRPEWERVGVTMAISVDPFEQMRTRLLNAGYFAIAHLGGLAGFRTVASAMKDMEIERFISIFLDDAIATLSKHTHVKVADYKQAILKRFVNSLLNQSTAQLAMNGSQTLGQLILNPLNERLSRGLGIEAHAMVVAAWVRYLMGRNELQENLELSDPLLEPLMQAIGKAGVDARSLVGTLVGFREVFGPSLPDNPVFVQSVTAALQSLRTRGVRASLSAVKHNVPVPEKKRLLDRI
ncbi:MAG TPA: mannitol dehydrogenase family protein [Eoetvoesiella sp.]